jgi:hypothetical protein
LLTMASHPYGNDRERGKTMSIVKVRRPLVKVITENGIRSYSVDLGLRTRKRLIAFGFMVGIKDR